MGFKQQLLAALTLAGIAAPALSAQPWESRPGVMYYVRVPLDANSPKERDPVFGLAMQGKREYETINLDSRMLNFIGGGIEAKFLVAGAIALGAAMAVGGGKGGESSRQEPQRPAPAARNGAASNTSSGPAGGTPASPEPCPEICPKPR